MAEYKLTTPLSDEDIIKLKAGDKVLLSGVIYTARDAAHMRIVASLEKGEELPFDPKGQVIYYVGPSPARPGKPIGSAGPTTSYRMNSFAPKLIAIGQKGMIGKGKMSQEVKDACVKYKACYFASIGGAAAVVGSVVKKAEIIAYPELGPEAVRKLEVEDMPLFVCYDSHGNDLYEMAKKEWANKL
jgi:fumarate hydratase subunit beta